MPSSLLALACLALLCGCAPGEPAGYQEERGDLPAELPAGESSFGLEADLINKFAYAAWAEGAFVTQLDESILEEALREDLRYLSELGLWLELEGELRLPPVLTLEPGRIVMSVGELHVDLVGGTDLGQLAAHAVIAAKVQVDISIEGGALGLASSTTPEDIHFDLEVRSFAGLKAEAVESIVEALAPSYLEAQLSQLSSIPVPTIDLTPSGFDAELGLADSRLSLSEHGAVLSGQLSYVSSSEVFERGEIVRPPVTDSSVPLQECGEPDPERPGVAGDCCTSAETGALGVCTELDPDQDGVEEAFCPSGEAALRWRCPSGSNSVKCCVFPTN